GGLAPGGRGAAAGRAGDRGAGRMRVLRLLWRGLVAAALLLFRRGRRRAADRDETEPEPTRREARPSGRAENAVLALLALEPACALAFAVLYGVDDDTQLLGLGLGLALALLAGASIVAAKWVVPQETAVEERPELERPGEADEVVEIARRGGEGISRRR